MEKFFSVTANKAKASEVREILKIAQKPGIISFGGGLPSPDSFPVEEMKKVVVETLEESGHMTMQYGTTEGLESLRNLIVKIMDKRFVKTAINNIAITTGSQQGLNLTGKVFVNTDDVIACESPTYLAAISAFRPYNPVFEEVEMDEQGMRMDALESLLSSKKVKFIYTIPDFQNPSGRSMSVDRRKEMLALAKKYDVLIIEDSPYSELAYDGDPLPPIKSFDEEGRVIYLSTFSKIVCPGFRTGWICADEQFISKYVMLKQGLDLHTNQFSQYAIEKFFRTYDLDGQINGVRDLYKVKRDAMLKAIDAHFPEEIKISRPTGGMFVWGELPEGINAKALLPEAIERNVAYVPGSPFYPNTPKVNTIRLNFSSPSIEQIEEGIKILGDFFKEEIQKL